MSGPRVEAQPDPDPDLVRDARESEDWFLRLPPAVQEETRAVWRRREAQLGGNPEFPLVRRIAGEAALILTGVVLFADLLLFGSFGQFLLCIGAAALFGALAGAALTHCGGERFTAALFGTIAYVATQAIGGIRYDMLGLICFFFGCMLTANVFGVFGMSLQRRRSAWR